MEYPIEVLETQLSNEKGLWQKHQHLNNDSYNRTKKERIESLEKAIDILKKIK